MMEAGKETNISYTHLGDLDGLNDTMNITDVARNYNLQDRIDYFFKNPHFIFSITLGFVTFLANALSIGALFHIKRTMTTHIRLIISLNAADVLVSVSLLVHNFNMVFNPVLVPPFLFSPDERQVSACMIAFNFAFHQMATQISILNIMAMAVDHYMAVIKPLAYLTRNSKRQWVGIIIGMWCLSFCGGFSGFLTGVKSYKKVMAFLNYCEFITNGVDYQPEFVTWAMAVIAAVVITFIYLRIACKVCHVNSQMSNIRQGYIKNQKAIQTTLLIIATFVICWLPTCFFQVIMIIQVYQDESRVRTMIASFLQVNKYLNHLYLLNSLLDPIIYAFRLREMQHGYRCLFLRLIRCSCGDGCAKGDKRYTSSFRYNKDFTSMTSTVERGCLVNGTTNGLVFPGRRTILKKCVCDRSFTASRGLKEQMFLLQKMNRQKASKGQINLHNNHTQQACHLCCNKCGDHFVNPHLYDSPSAEFSLLCKARCYKRDSGYSPFQSPSHREISPQAAYMINRTGTQWCECTTSV